jgi:hypothetical protein
MPARAKSHAEHPRANPCTELETRGGIWRYDANKTNQIFSPAERFATGIRNAEGFGIDATGHAYFVTQHGRDQLHANWPDLYKPEEEATLPAEELLLLKQGGDYGWPECYYDGCRANWFSRPNTAATGARSGSVRNQDRSDRGVSRALGAQRNGAVRQSNSQPITVTACSSPSTDHGIGRPTPKAATTWSSKPWRAIMLRSLRDICRRICRCGEVTGPSRASSVRRRGRTRRARSTSPMMCADGSTASSTAADQARGGAREVHSLSERIGIRRRRSA